MLVVPIRITEATRTIFMAALFVSGPYLISYLKHPFPHFRVEETEAQKD